jgi:hypothetical protein
MPTIALLGIHSDRPRQVSRKDGERLAKLCHVPFFEASRAADVDAAVAGAVRLARKWRPAPHAGEAQWPAPFRVGHRMHEYYPTYDDYAIWERSPRAAPRPLPLPVELDNARLVPVVSTVTERSGVYDSAIWDTMPDSPSSIRSKDSGFSEETYWDRSSTTSSAASTKSKGPYR